jgi:hypothetical protein
VGAGAVIGPMRAIKAQAILSTGWRPAVYVGVFEEVPTWGAVPRLLPVRFPKLLASPDARVTLSGARAAFIMDMPFRMAADRLALMPFCLSSQ